MTRFWSRSAALRLVVVAAIASLALTAVACGDDDDDDDDDAPTTPGAATTAGGGAVTIGVADNKFEPVTQTVQRGAKVTWNWTGSNPHSVVGKFGAADVKSEQQTSGKFEFTFAQAGTFDYQCGVHGSAMTGKVTVQ